MNLKVAMFQMVLACGSIHGEDDGFDPWKIYDKLDTRRYDSIMMKTETEEDRITECAVSHWQNHFFGLYELAASTSVAPYAVTTSFTFSVSAITLTKAESCVVRWPVVEAVQH